MKKKFMAALLAGMMVLATGCGNKGKVTVGEYKGLALTSISQETLDTEIATMLDYYAELKEVDRAAAEGDTVNINYTGLLDGVAFEGGTDDSEEGTDLVLGSNSFIDGFEDGLIGAVANEQRDLNLTFPEEYSNNPDLAGKAVVFQVTVNAVKEEVVPELTDEFISGIYTDYATVDEFKEALRESLNTETYYAQITEQLMASSEVKKYDEDAVAVEKQSLIDEYSSMASYYGSLYGLDSESAIQYILGFESRAAFEEEMGNHAYDVVKTSMIIKEIAKMENIDLTKEEFDAKVTEYSAKYDFEDSASFIEQYGGEEAVKESMIAEMVMTFIIDNAVITNP